MVIVQRTFFGNQCQILPLAEIKNRMLKGKSTGKKSCLIFVFSLLLCIEK